MIPVVTPAEMGAIDAAAPEPTEVLIGRAGSAVAREARRLLGGCYGRRVIVLAGKGNNGNDGREAARLLRRRGVRVLEIDVSDAPSALPPADLVVDAAFGTGFRGGWDAPAIESGTRVLAVDIPSGLSGLTGEAGGVVLEAERTVTFAALKPGLLLGAGPSAAGDVVVADIGLDTSSASAHLLTPSDLALLPRRPRETHKWRSAVRVVAGSPGMHGAAALVAAGALRSGAGYVRLSTPGGRSVPGAPIEAVSAPLAADGWAEAVLADAARFGALVVGNGVGTADATAAEVRRVVASAPVPTVVDADGLTALGREAAEVVGPSVVLTPHDGEFARLAGGPPGPDRVAACRDLAVRLGCVVLLKGSTTVVSGPTGRVLLSAAGDARLATAGTGDVLAGVIGALCARGVPPFDAAGLGALAHGLACGEGPSEGFVASDLPPALADVLSVAAAGPAPA